MGLFVVVVVVCFVRGKVGGEETMYATFSKLIISMAYWRASEASETLLVVVQWETRYVYTYIYT